MKCNKSVSFKIANIPKLTANIICKESGKVILFNWNRSKVYLKNCRPINLLPSEMKAQGDILVSVRMEDTWLEPALGTTRIQTNRVEPTNTKCI